jgi:hypothetical protein
MEMIIGLRPQPPSYRLGLLVANCCCSWTELRLLYRQDRAFQQAVFRGYSPYWIYRNWQVKDRRFRNRRMSWVLTAILARHVSVAYMVMGFSILITIGLIGRMTCHSQHQSTRGTE